MTTAKTTFNEINYATAVKGLLYTVEEEVLLVNNAEYKKFICTIKLSTLTTKKRGILLKNVKMKIFFSLLD